MTKMTEAKIAEIIMAHPFLMSKTLTLPKLSFSIKEVEGRWVIYSVDRVFGKPTSEEIDDGMRIGHEVHTALPMSFKNADKAKEARREFFDWLSDVQEDGWDWVWARA